MILTENMENKAPFSISIKELASLGEDHLPDAFVPSCHLIYSSPATLSYNSPGAYGFGVKRAALVLPESVMLLVAPGCCGRNSSILGVREDYAERMFYLKMDETDLVSGRHLIMIPEAIRTIVKTTQPKPKAVVICITCVDALLGTDLERITRKAEEETGVRVVPSYMYALTREGRKPPMTAIRATLYSLLKREPINPRAVNLLGFFTPVNPESELFDLLHQMGIRTIRQISAMKTLDEYAKMGEANFNLVLDPESRFAAEELKNRLGIPYIELARLYDLKRIRKQYALFASAVGTVVNDEPYVEEAEKEVSSFTEKYAGRTVAIGQMTDAHPFELAYALTRLGLSVSCIIAIPSETDFPYIRMLAEVSPKTRVYTGISPTMIRYDNNEKADMTIGADIGGYFPNAAHVDWNSENQPFGYRGLIDLLKEMREALG